MTGSTDAETRLREANERMQLAARAAGIGFWTRDLADSREEWDDQMLLIYGLQRDGFDGRWEPHVHPEDLGRVQRETHLAIEQGVYGEYEYRIVHPAGGIRHVKGMSTAVRDPQGRPTLEIGVNVDITRQKQAEADLARAREAERRFEEARRRELETKLKASLTVAASVHEIKEPLALIRIETQLAVERLNGGGLQPEDIRGYLEKMLAESDRMVALIGRMKSLLRNVPSEHRPLCVGEVVASSLLFLKKTIADRGIRILDPGENTGLQAGIHAGGHAGGSQSTRKAVQIEGDGPQLQSAVINLIRNAIDAVADRPAGQREVLVDLRADAGGVVIIVGDNGPGIDSRCLDDLPFETTKPDGTGLGLYLARTCAENHGGRMTVGRSPLGGAEVRLELPAALALPAALELPTAVELHSARAAE
jgi:PAS domain S-box-containing protein